jgi:hypothetical protein
MDKLLEELVRARARGRCEYCHYPRPPFHFEHIIAIKHGGPTREDNLAFACMKCNFHKGPNIAGIDPQTQRIVPLFHPRKDTWRDHFRWRGHLLVGLTPAARATIAVLEINQPFRMQARERLSAEGGN